jgi:periplasmic divalent cation tolerance protein
MSASQSADQTLLVFVTCPAGAAAGLAAGLVEARVAACVNQVPGLQSVYRWQGQVETAAETLLIAKTTRARYADFEAEVRKRHPYELPEILAVSAACGLPAYLRWVEESVA